MLFSAVADLKKRKEAELIVFPFWERSDRPKPAASLEDLATVVKLPLSTHDFSGEEGELSFVYFKGAHEPRLLLVGLGKEESLSVESLRRVYAKVTRFCHKKNLAKINLVLPNIVELRRVKVDEFLKGVCEGIALTNYHWTQKTQNDKRSLLKSVTLLGILPKMLPIARQICDLCEAVHFARDLINGNADTVTPAYLAKTAENLSKKFPAIKTTVFDKKRLEKEKMGLLLAVGRGSVHDPKLILANYVGNPKSKDHTVVVGKGVTFDTGGLNLKPTGSMEGMRDDMSGAAAALGSVAAAAALGLKANVTAVIPTAENAIDAKSFKPGDVYVSHLGKSVEIGNTDAEGRLILADALSYTVQHLNPSRIIDFATLTGAMVIALGEGVAGLFCNHDKLATQLLEASAATSEILWRLPLHQPYKERLKSDIADIKNIGGRPGSAILAALFLEEFVGGFPWAHIDIAGTAFANKAIGYWPNGGVGFGVRLIIELLQKFTV